MASTNGTLSMIGAKATCLSGSSSARPNTCLPSSRDIWRHCHLHERGGRLRYVDRLAGHGGGQTNLKPTCLLLSKCFRDAYGLSGGLIGLKAAELATRSERDASGKGGGKPFGWL